MSDSSQPGWATIENNEHALTPLHLNDENAVTVDIDGSIGSLGLVVPTYAQITVHGNAPYTIGNQDYAGTYNFGFSGRNLSASQTTAINVTGNIVYRGDLTFEALGAGRRPASFAVFREHRSFDHGKTAVRCRDPATYFHRGHESRPC